MSQSEQHSNQAWQARREAAVVQGVGTLLPVFIDRAQNAELWDVEGNRYIDFASGIAVLNTGHCHPRIVEAIREQATRLTHYAFNAAQHEPYIALMDGLSAFIPVDYPVSGMLTNSGAEAAENALKIVRGATGRSAVIAFDGAFHGRTLATLNLNGKVAPPGSKSITNRALLLAALAKGTSRLSGALKSDDTRHMSVALRQMGVTIDEPDDTTFVVTGQGKLQLPAQPLFLGNAGTAMRPLTAALAVLGGQFEMTGIARMYERPIGDLVDGLRQLGANVKYLGNEGFPPVDVARQLLAFPLLGCPALHIGVQVAVFDGVGQGHLDGVHGIRRTGQGQCRVMQTQGALFAHDSLRALIGWEFIWTGERPVRSIRRSSDTVHRQTRLSDSPGRSAQRRALSSRWIRRLPVDADWRSCGR